MIRTCTVAVCLSPVYRGCPQLCETHEHNWTIFVSIEQYFLCRSEESILVSTAVLAKSIQTLNCRKLLEGEHSTPVQREKELISVVFALCTEFVRFVLCDSCDPRAQSTSLLLIETLISRVDHNNHEVSERVATLDLLFVSVQCKVNSL